MVQGGSTLTQQLAKNLFLNPDRTIERKLQEVVLAVWLEWHFTKEEILQLYLNRVYFGAGATGIEKAAQTYFQKPASELNLAEAATLAGVLKAPSASNPAIEPQGRRRARQARAAEHGRCRLHHAMRKPPRAASQPAEARAARAVLRPSTMWWTGSASSCRNS